MNKNKRFENNENWVKIHSFEVEYITVTVWHFVGGAWYECQLYDDVGEELLFQSIEEYGDSVLPLRDGLNHAYELIDADTL